MQPLDTKAMQFVYEARLEMAANNRRGYERAKPSSLKNLFHKMWKEITVPTSRIENSRKSGKKSIS